MLAEGDKSRAGLLLAEAARQFSYAGQPLDSARCPAGSAGPANSARIAPSAQ